jgi:hypothetical protein
VAIVAVVFIVLDSGPAFGSMLLLPRRLHKAFWPTARAAVASRERELGGPFRSSCKTFTAIFTSRCFHSSRARRVKAMWFTEASGSTHFGIGVGTIVLALNVILLGGYTFGCHSLRHLIGGFLDEISNMPVCAKGYSCVSCLNRRHMLWAWMSLFWVGFTAECAAVLGRLAH